MTEIQFKLRLPADLKERIDREAVANSRSLTAEIVHRLEASFRRSVDDDQIAAYTKRIKAGIERLDNEAKTAKVGAAVSAHLLRRVIENEMKLLPLDEKGKEAFDKVRNAAAHIVEAYKDVVDDEHGSIAELLDGIERKASEGSERD